MGADTGQGGEDVRARFVRVALPHFDVVLRMARVLGSDESEADDLVQETFIRAFRAFDRFELRAYGARPWLLRILHNVFFTQRVQAKRRPTLLDDIDFEHFADELDDHQSTPLTADSVDWDQFDEEVKAGVTALQPEYRAVLLLWALEGLTYKEIAGICDCPLGTVMSRLYRARQLLGRALRDYASQRKLNLERFK